MRNAVCRLRAVTRCKVILGLWGGRRGRDPRRRAPLWRGEGWRAVKRSEREKEMRETVSKRTRRRDGDRVQCTAPSSRPAYRVAVPANYEAALAVGSSSMNGTDTLDMPWHGHRLHGFHSQPRSERVLVAEHLFADRESSRTRFHPSVSFPPTLSCLRTKIRVFRCFGWQRISYV